MRVCPCLGLGCRLLRYLVFPPPPSPPPLTTTRHSPQVRVDGKLSAEVLLGMLSEKGADVRSVVDQLMSTGQQGFVVEALKQQPPTS